MRSSIAARRFAFAGILALLALGTARSASPEPADLAPLEGTWVKLPRACGSGSETLCGGDSFTIHAGVLNARKSCKGVRLVAREHRGAVWRLDVAGNKACIWNRLRVRSFLFTLEEPRVDFVAYAGPSAEPGAELFRAVGFERN